MYKKLIITLITFAVVLSQCHNSCATCNINVCLSCDAENAEVDQHIRACVCKQGFYASQLNPLKCEELLQGNEEDACEKEIGLNIGDFEVKTLCYFSNENDSGQEKSFVISEVSIDTDHSQFNGNSCRNSVFTKIEYRPKDKTNPKEDDNYIDLPNSNYVSDLPGGKSGDKKIKIPLIDIYGLAFFQDISSDGNQIIQEVYFRILIGFTRKFLRSHRWIMTVYTNRNQVQTFVIDVDIQRTESCQDGQECIIIADLDVTGDQYQSNFVDLRNHLYTVGDFMYIRIWFKDATYTKQLSFQKLFFKNDQGQVFDHTSLTDANETKWNSGDKSLHVKLRLIEPSSGAIVQVNMLIETIDARLLRRLQDSSNSVKSQFKASIFSPLPSDNANQDENKSMNSIVVFFGLLNLLALIFYY